MLHQAGIGVLGPVFRAHDLSSDRLVAIKAIKLDILPEVTTALIAELRRLAATPIDHPSAVPVFHAGVEGGRPFVVAEYVAGESFDIALRHRAPAPLSDALPLLDQMAGAIDAAWAAGVGHGALHPRDIFLVPAAPSVRVTGFGIAHALERVGLSAPVRRPYTAPERAEGRPWDIRADVYALGAIAHELLAGRRPAAVGEQDGALSAVPAPLRKPVRLVLTRALAADPAERFATALDLVRALEAIGAREAAGVVPPARPPEPPLLIEPDVPASPVQAPEATADPADLPLLPAPPVVPAPAAPALDGELSASRAPMTAVGTAPPSYPWGAIAAVAVAGIALGAVGGYAVGRGSAVPDPVSLTAAVDPAADTEVAVVPPAAPPSAPPDVQPASRRTTIGAGRIVVRSVPAGALVTLDGRHAGETPMTLTDLPYGTHTLVVARPGYVPRTERVTLSAGQPARQLTLDLVPGVDAGRAQLGSVYVDSRPRGARVSIDGRLVGATPIGVPELAIGSHSIRLDLEGFVSQTSTVTVRSGEQARVTVTFGRAGRR